MSSPTEVNALWLFWVDVIVYQRLLKARAHYSSSAAALNYSKNRADP